MKSMKIESVLKPSSFSKSPLVPTSVSCSHGNVQVSRAHVRNIVRMKHDVDVKFGRSYSLKDQGQKAKFLASAASDIGNDYGVSRPHMDRKSVGAMFDIIYKFSKVYTLAGTSLCIISVSLLAIQNLSEFTPSFFLGVLQAVLGGILANSYVAGINQLSDIEIDKVNKPYLVLVSGELPVKIAILLTSLYAFLGFCLGWSVKSWPFRLGLFLWYAFGTAYSVHLPLLRWKRNHVLAAVSIALCHGSIPILFHLHVQSYIAGRTLLLSKHAIFVSGIMSIYGLVLALFKDIPDIEGDKLNGINSLASQIGQKRVFWICIWLLEMVYGMAILTGMSSTHFWIRLVMVIGHSILGFIVWRNANLVDLKSNEATESFYRFIWKLYYVENLLVTVSRF